MFISTGKIEVVEYCKFKAEEKLGLTGGDVQQFNN